MRLIITRHGQTEENKAGVFMGHMPGKLSEEGIDQAKKVALRLQNEKIDFIYSSDLARSSDTTKEIAKFHQNVPIEFIEDLRERNLGEIQGKSRTELGWSKEDSHSLFREIKGGESMENMHKRAEIFLHKILSKHYKDTVLIVAHNGINKAIIATITNKSPDDIEKMENFRNTSLSIFEIDENKDHKIHLLNDTEHLK